MVLQGAETHHSFPPAGTGNPDHPGPPPPHICSSTSSVEDSFGIRPCTASEPDVTLNALFALQAISRSLLTRGKDDISALSSSASQSTLRIAPPPTFLSRAERCSGSIIKGICCKIRTPASKGPGLFRSASLTVPQLRLNFSSSKD